MEEIISRHRREKRDLQAKITQKKKNATKKTRKGVYDECERLERELAEKQRAELQELQPVNASELTEKIENLVVDEHDAQANGEVRPKAEDTKNDQYHSKKPNRQKARLARRAAEQDAQAAAAAKEAEDMPDQREQELAAMKEQMKKLNLSETPISPDGHCLFSACAHSMTPDMLASQLGEVRQAPYQSVRRAAADFMAKHPVDFEAFMEEPLESYVRKIRDTAEWGGELELQAIARSYKVDINVLRANGQVDRVTSQHDSKEQAELIWLAYYQHNFGLGEHYNALRSMDKS